MVSDFSSVLFEMLGAFAPALITLSFLAFVLGAIAIFLRASEMIDLDDISDFFKWPYRLWRDRWCLKKLKAVLAGTYMPKSVKLASRLMRRLAAYENSHSYICRNAFGYASKTVRRQYEERSAKRLWDYPYPPYAIESGFLQMRKDLSNLISASCETSALQSDKIISVCMQVLRAAALYSTQRTTIDKMYRKNADSLKTEVGDKALTILMDRGFALERSMFDAHRFLDGLYINVLAAVTTENIPLPETTVSEPSLSFIVGKITEAAKQCKSVIVAQHYEKLRTQLDAFLAAEEVDQDIARQLASYYLPTLQMVLENLSAAKAQRSSKVKDQEQLALRSIAIVSGILNSAMEDLSVKLAMETKSEVEVMENIAKMRGHITEVEDVTSVPQVIPVPVSSKCHFYRNGNSPCVRSHSSGTNLSKCYRRLHIAETDEI